MHSPPGIFSCESWLVIPARFLWQTEMLANTFPAFLSCEAWNCTVLIIINLLHQLVSCFDDGAEQDGEVCILVDFRCGLDVSPW